MFLDKIIEEKKKEVNQLKGKTPLDELIKQAASFPEQLRDFKGAISRPGKINLIAEIKKASPSGGILRKDFQPLEIACAYQSGGAAALSILTDKKFFQGDIAYLQSVHDKVKLPILRKDFIIDKYQIYQSLCRGADAVLLIARLLTEDQLAEFYALCCQLKLAAVCEVHSEDDLDKVLALDAEIIGINNRDLDSFKTNLTLTARLTKKIPDDKIVISESAIKTKRDVKHLRQLGVHAVLIGEAFMRSRDIAAAVKEIISDD